jgi:hypothetical protein
LEESKTPNYKDDEPCAYEETAEKPSVTDTPEQVSVIEMEVNVPADPSEEDKTPNPKEGCPVSEERIGSKLPSRTFSLKQKLVRLLELLKYTKRVGMTFQSKDAHLSR